jgi:phage-related protein
VGIGRAFAEPHIDQEVRAELDVANLTGGVEERTTTELVKTELLRKKVMKRFLKSTW